MRAVTELLQSVVESTGTSGSGASTDEDDQTEGASERGTGADRDGSSLYRCPTCETVYIAGEKRTCSTCQSDVERVPATLSDD
jgi:hypothetical protein